MKTGNCISAGSDPTEEIQIWGRRWGRSRRIGNGGNIYGSRINGFIGKRAFMVVGRELECRCCFLVGVLWFSLNWLSADCALTAVFLFLTLFVVNKSETVTGSHVGLHVWEFDSR